MSTKMSLPSEEQNNQTRTLGLPLKSSDPDQMEMVPWVTPAMKSNPAKLHRCVNQVKKSHSEDSAYAICQASMKRGKG